VARTDVVRLGMICGPASGMTKLGETHVGQLSEDKPTASVHFKAVRSACYRVFAAVSGSGSDPIELDLSLLSSRQSRLAQDRMTGSWAVLDADKAICTFADDTFELHIEADDSALARSLEWAAEIWKLPPQQ
jgi:hypothetical protein